LALGPFSAQSLFKNYFSREPSPESISGRDSSFMIQRRKLCFIPALGEFFSLKETVFRLGKKTLISFDL